MKAHPILTQLINTIIHLSQTYSKELINITIYLKEADLTIKNPSLEDIELLIDETETTDNILVTITIQSLPIPKEENPLLDRVTNNLAIVDKIIPETINGWTKDNDKAYRECDASEADIY